MKFSKSVCVVASSVSLLLAALIILPVSLEKDFLHAPSEKSQIMDAPQGHPDMFFQYLNEIRADENGVVDYPMGYRTTEFEKAIERAKNASTTLPWVERGPGNVGGRTRPILVDPDDPDMNTWWAGSVGGGLWRTINGGYAWQYQSDDKPVMSISSLAMSGDVIYMGTGEGFGNLDGVDGEGIFKSTDRGETWTQLSSTATDASFRHVNRMAVDPANPDILVAATGFGIFKTTDGGATWTETYTGPGRVQDLRAQPGNYNRMIAGVNGQGIFVSDDSGDTWAQAPAVFLNGVRRVEVAFAPSNPSIAYAAVEGSSSGLMRSNDGGMTWTPTYDSDFFPINWMGAQGWYDNALAVHPFNPDTLFVGGIQLFRIRMGGDVETLDINAPSSFDLGGSESWLALVNFGAPGFGGTLAYLSSDAVDLTSADYPSSVEIRFGQGSQKAHRFTVAEDAGSFGNGGSGIPFSEYQYADYVDVPLQVWDTENNRQLMFSFRDQADDGEFNLIEFFSSDDVGTRDSHSREYMFTHKYDYDDTDPHADIAADGGLVYGQLYFIWPTLVANATWDPANLPMNTMTIEFLTQVETVERIVDAGGISNTPHVDHHAIEPLPVPGSSDEFWIINANDGGVALSTTGGDSFRETDAAFSGYNTSQFYGVSKKPGEQIYFGGTQDNGTWRSFGNPDNRRGWISSIGGDGFETVWHATDPDKMMGTIQFTLILRSTNGGTTFQNSFQGGVNGLFITSLGTSDTAPEEVYTVTATGVHRTMDFGATWESIPISSNWSSWSGCKVRVSNPNPDIVWAGCGLNNSDSGRRLHVSMDKGATFAVAGPADVPIPPEGAISGLATHPTEEETAYALFSRYGRAKLLETKDTGATWVDLSAFDSTSAKSTNGFPDVPIHDLVVMPHSTNVIWVGTDIGLFQSKSYGQEWNYAHNGLPAVSIWRMKVRDEEVIVGTHGRGVWTVPTGDINVAIEGSTTAELPSGFALEQNYPNPFNPSTAITFSVPEEAHVKITVFDAIGRRVSVLTDQSYAPGSHELMWDASAHASGVYFYRMEVGGTILQARKMTLVK